MALNESWSVRLARYRGPDRLRSILQLTTAALLFAGAWALMYFSLSVTYWLTLLLAVPTAFFLIRLFIIQHDCGHAAFFRSAWVSDTVGSIIGVLTLTPYHYWKKTHAMHHATSGNLEHRGFGDIDTLTVEEYLARPRWERFKYRVYRHPVVLFGVGAILHFFVRHRLPTIVPKTWRRERRSIFWTDVGLATFIVVMGALVGYRQFALVQLPIAALSTIIGVWLFYVQHQFDPTYWEREERWSYDAAALHGSSYYRLPRVLQWATGNIGIHHVHHLHPRIPNYRLERVLRDNPELAAVQPLTLWGSLRCVRLTLWDERERKLVPFRAVRGRAPGNPGPASTLVRPGVSRSEEHRLH